MLEKCVICEARILPWQAKRYFKSPPILNPVEYEEGWCHKSCELEHFDFLVRFYLKPEMTWIDDRYAFCWKAVGINVKIAEHLTQEELQMIVKYWGDKWGLDGK